MSKRLVNIVGILIIVVGSIWTLQGLNVLLGSFMSGRSEWIRNGSIVWFAGIILLFWNNRKRNKPN